MKCFSWTKKLLVLLAVSLTSAGIFQSARYVVLTETDELPAYLAKLKVKIQTVVKPDKEILSVKLPAIPVVSDNMLGKPLNKNTTDYFPLYLESDQKGAYAANNTAVKESKDEKMVGDHKKRSPNKKEEKKDVKTAVQTLDTKDVRKTMNNAAKENADKDKKIFEQLVDAYIYAYPLVLMNKMEKDMTSSVFFAPKNKMAYFTLLPDSRMRYSECPNVDSLFSTVWFDLSDEPQVVCMPENPKHHYIMELLDAWTNVIKAFGDNQVSEYPTATLEGRSVRFFVLVGPGTPEKDLPKGIKIVKSPTDSVWLINRVLLGAPQDDLSQTVVSTSRTLYEFEVMPFHVFKKETGGKFTGGSKISWLRSNPQFTTLSSFSYAKPLTISERYAQNLLLPGKSDPVKKPLLSDEKQAPKEKTEQEKKSSDQDKSSDKKEKKSSEQDKSSDKKEKKSPEQDKPSDKQEKKSSEQGKSSDKKGSPNTNGEDDKDDDEDDEEDDDDEEKNTQNTIADDEDDSVETELEVEEEEEASRPEVFVRYYRTRYGLRPYYVRYTQQVGTPAQKSPKEGSVKNWEQSGKEEVKKLEQSGKEEVKKLEQSGKEEVKKVEQGIKKVGQEAGDLLDRGLQKGSQWSKEGMDYGRDAIEFMDRRMRRDMHRLARQVGSWFDWDNRSEMPDARVSRMNGTEFFETFASLLEKNPAPSADQKILETMKELGLSGKDGKTIEQDPRTAYLMRFAIPFAQSKIQQTLIRESCKTTKTGNWIVPENLGRYGTDYLRRAVVAHEFIGANIPEQILYPFTLLDKEGKFLNGKNEYVLHFPAGQTPPTDLLWSLTMYDQDHYLVPNRLNRFGIRSNQPLVFNQDGSLTIRIQKEEPKEMISNWLPAPEGEFLLMLRIYQPKESVLKGEWKIPAVEKSGK